MLLRKGAAAAVWRSVVLLRKGAAAGVWRSVATWRREKMNAQKGLNLLTPMPFSTQLLRCTTIIFPLSLPSAPKYAGYQLQPYSPGQNRQGCLCEHRHERL
jgi:hypothetical protein